MFKFFGFFLGMILASSVYGQSFTEQGYATYYADHFENRPTASGEIFSQRHFTCAHANHPFGTILKVTRVDNGKSVTVRVNDRGGFGNNIIVDLSKAAAAELDFISAGKTMVKAEVVGYSADPVSTQTQKGSAPSFPNESANLDVNSGRSNVAISYLPQGQKGIFLQLASYSIRSNAESQYKAWKQKGISAIYINEINVGGQSKFTLVMGPFSTRGGAEQKLRDLKTTHFMDGFVKEFK